MQKERKKTIKYVILYRKYGASKEEQAATLKKFNIRSPVTNNELSEPIEFNLMFQVLFRITWNDQ